MKVVVWDSPGVLGQLLGLGLRARHPLPLPLLPSVWRSLAGEEVAWEEAGEEEPATSSFLSTLEQMEEAEWEEQEPITWTFPGLTGGEVELVEGGRERVVGWRERRDFCSMVRALRVREWGAKEQVAEVLGGLATLAPLHLLRHLYTPGQLEVELCGEERIDLAFLRAHTMYQAGLYEDDPHIGMFWTVLGSFTQHQLGRLVKFACNQVYSPFHFKKNNQIPMFTCMPPVTRSVYPPGAPPPCRRRRCP